MYKGSLYAVVVDSLMRLEGGRWANVTKLGFPTAVAAHGDYIYVQERYFDLVMINERLEKRSFRLPVEISQVAFAGSYAVLVYGTGFSVVRLGDVKPGGLVACNFAAPWDVFGVRINGVVVRYLSPVLPINVPCVTLTNLIPGVYRIEAWKIAPQDISGIGPHRPPESRVYDVWVEPGGTALFADLYTSAI